MKKFKRTLALALVLILSVAGLFAKTTPVENLHQYQLENGLTLFVAENHSVPLTYIEIAVRTGAVEQTPENAGLFHLYEHMMFKGNELYPSAAAIQNALSEMGVASWNGTTGKDYVNYFITVPSSQTEKGLAFWNAAVRTPLMDPKEFENEKKVVISEITGYEVNPGNIYQNYVSNTLFPESGYRNDPAGTRKTIQSATVAQLRDIQKKFYIPSNAALFVGGDVDPEKTYQLVKAIYGTWDNNGNSPTKPHDQPTKTPLNKMKLAVMPHDAMSPYVAQVSVTFRGPDTDFDLDDTYAADYLCSLLAEPDGLFKTKLVQDAELGIPQSDYANGGYTTVRASGMFNFSAIMLQPENNLPERSVKLLKKIQDDILPQIAAEKSLYQKSKVKQIVSIMESDRISSTDTATNLLSLLRFWWAATSSDYYFSYYKKLGTITQKSMQNLVNEYFTGKNALVTVLVNPQVYQQTVAQYKALGFEVIDANNAYWWNNPKFVPDAKKVAGLTDTSSPEKIPVYKPAQDSGKDNATLAKENVTEFKLKNGIPVYVLTDKTKKIDTVSVCVKGGLSHLTTETSGLEGALFQMMSQSSEKYSFEARQKISFETGANLNHYTDPEYSTLSLSVLDKNLYTTLPMMLDGLVNPKFDESVFANNMNNYLQEIQQTLNNPSSLIMYTAQKTVYQGHPYQTTTSVTQDSIGNISIDAMKKLHSEIINPNEMFIVAVGNINAKKLVTELNKSIGTIQAKKTEATAKQDVPKVSISGKPVVLGNKNVAGNGYALRVFPAPSVTSADYIPACIANKIYSDIMFNVVRERRGICYTPLSTTNRSRAPIGAEVLVNLTDYNNFASAVSEARNLMSSGKVIKSLDEKGNYTFDTLANSLESYRNKYINSSFSELATSMGKAAKLIDNLVYFEDIAHDTKEMEELQAISASDILRVFKTYWVDEGSRWFAIVGPGDENRLKFN